MLLLLLIFPKLDTEFFLAWLMTFLGLHADDDVLPAGLGFSPEQACLD